MTISGGWKREINPVPAAVRAGKGRPTLYRLVDVLEWLEARRATAPQRARLVRWAMTLAGQVAHADLTADELNRVIRAAVDQIRPDLRAIVRGDVGAGAAV